MLAVVDQTAMSRGLDYARRQRAGSLSWSKAARELFGKVQGQRAHKYTTKVSFEPRGDVQYPVDSFCSCPLGGACKHVAALLITAKHSKSLAAGSSGGGVKQPPPWQRKLEGLLAPASGHSAQSSLEPLGIRFELIKPAGSRRQDPPKLGVRWMRRNERGRWVQSQLRWGQMAHSAMHHYYTDPLAAYPHGLREWAGTFSTLLAAANGYLSYTAQTASLDRFSSKLLWSLLGEAEGHGIQLLAADGSPLRVHEPAAVALDLQAAGPKLEMSARLNAGPESVPAGRMGLVGSPAHGLYWWEEQDDGVPLTKATVHLAALAEPLPDVVASLLAGDGRVSVPGTGREAFLRDFVPTLQRRTSLVSSDGSVQIPEPRPARLRLTAEHVPPRLVRRGASGGGHPAGHLELTWSWIGQGEDDGGAAATQPLVSDSVPLHADELRAIQTTARALAAHPQMWQTAFPHPAIGFPGDPEPFYLSGMDAARVVTEAFPLFADLDAAELIVHGTAPDYRELTQAPEIEVRTAETDHRDWFDLGVKVTLAGTEVPFGTLFTALAEDAEYLMLPNGNYFSLDRPEYQKLRDLIEEARQLSDTESQGLRISRYQADLFREFADLATSTELAASWNSAVAGLLAGPNSVPAEVPASLRAELRPYQRDGFTWLAFLHDHGLGGVLADDMGLGKTLQTLALICHARAADPKAPPFLVVAPTSVVPNWAAEVQRFAPGLRCLAITETLAKSGTAANELAAADVVVVSYALFRLDNADYAGMQWSGLLLDEAQFVKNPAARASTLARNFPAPFKLAITGTPLENNLMELWSMFAIAAPGLFPAARRFEEYYRGPIEKEADADRLAQLRRRIRPLMMRRSKEVVAGELPPKQEQVLELDLRTKHRTIYQRHLQHERQKVLGLLGDLDKNRFQIFRSLTMLRMLSLDASLVDPKYATAPSSKLDALMEQLPDVIEEGHQALVFSQFTSFLGKAADRLEAAGIDYAYLDGKTRGRAKVIEKFTSGKAPVFLISLKAGGFGLNLTQADYCFMLDPWWNPATENQAVDRAHRIGQRRNVMVYRMVAKDTIEEKVMALKEKKAKLFSAVMDEDAMFSSALTAEDIRTLLDAG